MQWLSICIFKAIILYAYNLKSSLLKESACQATHSQSNKNHNQLDLNMLYIANYIATLSLLSIFIITFRTINIIRRSLRDAHQKATYVY